MNNKILCFFLLFALFGCIAQEKNKECVVGASNHYDRVDMKYSHDGKYISIGDNYKICVLDADTYSVQKILKENETPYFSDFVWLSDDETIVTVQENGLGCEKFNSQCVKFFDVKTGESAATLKFSIYSASSFSPSLALSPNGEYVAMLYSHFNDEDNEYIDGFYIINIENQKVVEHILLNESVEDRISFSPSGKYIKIEEDTIDQAQVFYSTSDYKIAYTYLPQENDSYISLLSWPKDGKTLVGIKEEFYLPSDGGYTTHYKIAFYSFMDNESGIEITPIKDVELELNFSKYKMGNIYPDFEDIKFSPDGQYIALGGDHHVSACPSDYLCSLGFIFVFDTKTDSIIFFDEGGKFNDNTVYFDWSPYGKKLAYIFSGESNEEIKTISYE